MSNSNEHDIINKMHKDQVMITDMLMVLQRFGFLNKIDAVLTAYKANSFIEQITLRRLKDRRSNEVI